MSPQNHLFWRSLIEVSGPFLEVQVLEKYLPQGFPKLSKHVRKKVVQAYNEWYEAVDTDNPLLPKLHNEWIRIVLEDLLEFDSTVLKSNDTTLRSVEERDDTRPSFVLYKSEMPQLLIDTYPPDTPLLEPSKNVGFVESPVEKMTNLCKKSNCEIGLLTNGEEWILVNATEPINCGYSIWYAKYWWLEPITLRAFHSLLEIRRFFGPDNEKLPNLFKESSNYTEEITTSLGNQVKRAVEILVQSLDKADQDRNRELLSDIDTKELYDASLIVMMRLVFILCAEERGLLLSGDPTYDEYYAISTLRAQLNEQVSLNGESFLNDKFDAWSRLMATFRILYYGIKHENFRLSPLGGSLFHPDKYPFLEGRAKKQPKNNAIPLPVNNRTVLKLLNSLEVLNTPSGNISMSYKALNVEQIGHVYEGLLDFTVKRASQVTVGFKTNKSIKSNLFEITGIKDRSEKDISEMTGRTLQSIKKDIEKDSHEILPKIISFFGNNQEILSVITPFANLIEIDNWGEPILYKEGSYVVVPGPNRRDTGAHYTPKELTEKIISDTLIPFESNDELINIPEKILNFKVCDPAMGSGAFLVGACDFLSKKLLAAWDYQEKRGKEIGINGCVIANKNLEHLPKDKSERKILARRLIAEKCLYGVDINPLAVELAKLSLWLFTLSKGKPLEFLDHNLKIGDALNGIFSIKQLLTLSLKGNETNLHSLFQNKTKETLRKIIDIRKSIEAISPKEMADIKMKNSLQREFDRSASDLQFIADYLFIKTLKKLPNENQEDSFTNFLFSELEHFLELPSENQIQFKNSLYEEFNVDLPNDRIRRKTFHWPIEFPEVFIRKDPGFDALIGNPPFLGSNLWKGILGNDFKNVAKLITQKAPGKIDLCLVFHLRAINLIKTNGVFGLLATSNIAEGESVAKGPAVLNNIGTIYKAYKGMPWPGSASVEVAIIYFFKGSYHGQRSTNDIPCTIIDDRLEPANEQTWDVMPIKNSPFSSMGVDNGKGLAFLIEQDNPWYKTLLQESQSLLRPYITGEDITSNAMLSPKRFALDIGNRSLESIKNNFPTHYEFLLAVVQPTRTEEKLKTHKGLIDRWWQFWNTRDKFFERARKQKDFIVFSRVTKYPICMLASSRNIYTDKVFIIANERPDMLAICLSSFFKEWLKKFSGGKLEGRLSISKKQSVSKFPLPPNNVSEKGKKAAGFFDSLAKEICSKTNKGLTDIVNQINDSSNIDKSITQLREAIRTIDEEVGNAYAFNGHFEYEYSHNGKFEEFSITEATRVNIINLLIEHNRKIFLQENET